MPRDFEKGILRILDKRGNVQGSGFLVTSNLGVTCAHVISACQSKPGAQIEIILHATGEKVSGYVDPVHWKSENEGDVAFIKFLVAIKESAPLPLGYSRCIDRHGFTTIGFPDLTNTEGILGSGSIIGQTLVYDLKMLQLESSEVTRGFSGAPVFDLDHQRVVGMIQEITIPDRYQRLADTAFALPCEALQAIHDGIVLRIPHEVERYVEAVRKNCDEMPYLSLYDIQPDRQTDEYISPTLKWISKTGDERELEADKLFEHNKGWSPLMLVGGAGAGKSTFLRRVAKNAWLSPKTVGLESGYIPLFASMKQVADLEGPLPDRINALLRRQFALPDSARDYFTLWSQEVDAPWLILLDGLDEIPAGSRKEVEAARWLLAAARESREYRMIVTSRPSPQVEKIKAAFTGSYQFLPFSSEKTRLFAQNWFGENASMFEEEFKGVAAADLTGTPLLLTIAAVVYSRSKMLPPQYAGLYREFVLIWLREAAYRGLEEQLDLRIRAAPGGQTLHVDRLGHVALRMKQTGRNDFDSAVEFTAEFLKRHEELPAVHARMLAKHYLEVMSQRSGLLYTADGVCAFIHPVFQDYFSATALVQKCSGEGDMFWKFLWETHRDDSWLETAKQCASLLAEQSVDIGRTHHRARLKIFRLIAYRRGFIQKMARVLSFDIPVGMFLVALISCAILARMNLGGFILAFFFSLIPLAFIVRMIFEALKENSRYGGNWKEADLQRIRLRDGLVDVISESWCPSLLETFLPLLLISLYERDRYDSKGRISSNYERHLVTDAYVHDLSTNTSHEQVHIEFQPIYRFPDKWYGPSLVRTVKRLGELPDIVKIVSKVWLSYAEKDETNHELQKGLTSLFVEIVRNDPELARWLLDLACPPPAYTRLRVFLAHELPKVIRLYLRFNSLSSWEAGSLLRNRGSTYDSKECELLGILGELDHPFIVPALIEYYSFGSYSYRMSLLRALATIRSAEALAFVKNIADTGETEYIRKHAQELLIEENKTSA